MARDLVVRHDESVTEVLQRLGAVSGAEVRLVVPQRSMLGESRFNFQLLALQAEESGLRLLVESDDARVLSLAAAAGLMTRAGSSAPLAVPPHAAPAHQSRFGPWRPEQFRGDAVPARVRRRGRVRRLILYGAATAILFTGIIAAAVLVPSATITLSTSAQRFSTPIDLTAQPASEAAGITVRAASAVKQISGTFQATGQRNTPGARASGHVQYQNGCPTPIVVSQGSVLASRSGVEFVQQKAVTIAKGRTLTAPIQARSDGSNGNVAAGQITTLQNPGTYASCLKVTNPQATTGGKDARHQPVITQQDLTSAQAQLDQQAKQSIESELADELRAGEKQSDQSPVVFGTPDFTPDHPAGSAVGNFDATLTLKGTSDYYRPAQVRDAFRSALQARVAAGQELMPDDFAAQYETTAAPGGGLEFKGQAAGWVAPRLDVNSIRAHLAGRSVESASAYLHTLPVSQVSITQEPFPLPLLPLLQSRISIDYLIQQPPAPAPSPGAPFDAGS